MGFSRRMTWMIVTALLPALFASATGCGDGPSGKEVGVFHGQSAPVEIVTDQDGLPHIFAGNDLDLFYGQGYQLARERLFQLDYNRRRACGRLAEVFGWAKLDSDRLMRTLGLYRIAGESLDLLRSRRPDDYQLLRAFTAGLNRRVAEVTSGLADLPPEFAAGRFDFTPETYTEQEIMAIGQMILFSFSSTLEFDLLATVLDKLVPEFAAVPVYEAGGKTYSMIHNLPEHHGAIGRPAADRRLVRPPAARLGPANPLTPADRNELRAFADAILRYQRLVGTGEGSNGFAVHASRTGNGRSILVNDSHAGYQDPSNMFLSHINSREAGGRFDAAGYSFVGGPGIQVGTTRTVAWGATTAFADVMDAWDVAVEGEIALLGGRSLPILSETETIGVRRQDGSVQPEPFTVRRIEGHGVFFPDEVLPIPKLLVARGEVLVDSPAFLPTVEMGMYLGFGRMRAMADFEATVDMQHSGMQNWMAATADRIGYRTHGLVPDRGPRSGRPAANRLLDGSDPATLWTGAFLPDERLPKLDGSQPFIVTANNDPWGHTADNDPTNDEFYYGSYFSPGLRATRISQRLVEALDAGRLTVDQAKAIQMDDHSLLAEGLLPALRQAVLAVGSDASLDRFAGRPEIDGAMAELDVWDLRAGRDSRPAALFRLFLAHLARRTLDDEFGLFFEPLDDAQPVTMAKFALLAYQNDIADLLDGERNLHLVGALSDALAERESRGGPSLTWGDLHRAVFRTPDGRVSVEAPKDGDDSSPNVSQSHCWKEGAIRQRCEVSAGSVYRNVFSFSSDGRVIFEYHAPQSGRGLLGEWQDGVYRRMPWTRAEVEASAGERFVLHPPVMPDGE